MEETTKAPYWKPVLIYGAIYGVIGILLSVIFYFLSLQFKTWTQLVSLVVAIVVLVYCIRAYRNEYLGGYASFGKLLLFALGIAVIATILTTIYSYILMTVIDPDYLDKATQFQIEKFSNNPRVSESQLDTIIERIESKASVKRSIIMGFVVGIIMNFILGLIISAFVKKEENPVNATM